MSEKKRARELSQTSSLKQRAKLYAWLSAAFYLPEPEMAGRGFAQEGLQLQRLLLPQVTEEFLVALEQANSKAEHKNIPKNHSAKDIQHKPSRHERFLELKREHARLFIGPPMALIRPYESCYFGEERLMGTQSLKVSNFYEKYGVAFFGQEHCEPPDHLAVELEFLSMVCNGELQPAEKNPADAAAGTAKEATAETGAEPGAEAEVETEITAGPDLETTVKPGVEPDPARRHPVEAEFLLEHLARWGLLITHNIKTLTTEPLYLAAAAMLEEVVWPYAAAEAAETGTASTSQRAAETGPQSKEKLDDSRST